MKIIYKYPLLLVAEQALYMPAGAEFLSVQKQSGTICLWAAVDPQLLTEEAVIRMCGTGYAKPEGKYIGTVQDEEFVWHFFDGRKQ